MSQRQPVAFDSDPRDEVCRRLESAAEPEFGRRGCE